MNLQHKLAAFTILCFFFLSNVGASSTTTNNPTSPNQLNGEVSCTKLDEHPVCQASFKINPSGTLGNSGISTGTAVVNGVEVKFTCYAGSATQRQPRSCRW